MRKKKLGAFFLVLAILLITGLLTFKYFYSGRVSLFDENSYKVVRVIDGDTVVLNTGEIIRYIGIAAPELREKIKDKWVYNPEPFAEEAKEFNQKLVGGKKVRLEFDIEKRDSYGRLLAYVYVEDIFINAKILKEGLALLYTKPPNVKYVDLFVKLQKQARENNRKLWGIRK